MIRSALSRVPSYLWIAAVVAVLTWPVPSYLPPAGSLDPSWGAGLHMAARLGLDFGDEIAFTYGPLGFLAVDYLYYPASFAAALAASAAVHLVAIVVIARELSRMFGLAVTALLTYLLAAFLFPAVLGLAEVVTALVVVACTRAALSERGELDNGMAAGLAAVAAAVTLVKLSAGVVALAVVGVTVVVPLLRREERKPRVVRAAVVPAAYVAALILLWLITGQPLDALGSFLERSIELMTGYAQAMQYEDPDRWWEYLVALLSVALVGLLIARTTRTLSPASRLLVGGIFLLFALAGFRQGFTRHDTHSLLFFGPLALAMTSLASREHRRLWLVAAVPPVVAAAAALGQPVVNRLAVALDGPGYVVDTVRLASRERRLETLSAGAENVRGEYALPKRILGLMQGRTVHVDPYEAQVVWSHYGLRWRPAPLFQSYIAYTEGLDDANTRFLGSAEAPELILRHYGAVDGRVRRWESPGFMLEMLCRYRPVAVEARWALLARGPSRCGRPAGLGRRRARFGQTVPVPRARKPGEIVVARFEDIEEPLWQRIQGLALKPQVVTARLNQQSNVRLIRAHAGNPHLMSLPGCTGLIDPTLEPQPFVSVSLNRSVRRGRPVRIQGGEYSVSFSAVEFDCRRPR